MKQRILTGIIIACLFAVPFYLGGSWFSSLMFVIAFIAYTEWLKMGGISPIHFIGVISLSALTALFITTLFLEQSNYIVPIIAVITLVYLVTLVFNSLIKMEQFGFGLMGLVYIGVGCLSLAQLRNEEGLIWTLSILLMIISTDTGAYFIGKKWGKQKLAPKVSPNKTIEGMIGGTSVAILLSVFLQSAFQPFETYFYTILIALFVSLAGQLGDLVESAIKRYYGVKDSGKILPGHGGVLDRVDSWIFVFVVLSVLQLF